MTKTNMMAAPGGIGMRICLALAAMAVLVLPAWAADLPIEQINVSGAKSLRGIWKIGIPGSVEMRENTAGSLATADSGNADDGGGPAGAGSMMQSRTYRFGAARDQLCRIGGDDTLIVRCISFGQPDDGAVAFHGDQVTLAWNGNSSLRLVLRGALQSADRFTASFVMEMERERHSAPAPTAGDKINLAATTDEAGLGILLQGTLAGLSLGDNSLLVSGAPDVAAPKDLAALGRIQAVYHVGQAPLMRDPQARPALEVYAVEFINGERLCGIHLARGKVDGLRCV